ncbi:MAG: hypothetical protein JXO22_13685, partial [Phycisphaerae bacterium]|nr:hypothetical protein [Phycisphaerae bacterium]
MTDANHVPDLRLTGVCWPVLDFVINFTRQVRAQAAPAPDQVRYEAISALRDAEDIARGEATTERLWEDRVKAMMVYLIDYKMLNSNWEGTDFWF